MNPNRISVLLLAGLILSTGVWAQQPDARDSRRAFLSRSDLEGLRDRFESFAQSPAYSETLRRRAQLEAEVIGTRLRDGDFEVGDRVLLNVEGEPTLADTFTVDRNRILRLGEMGEVPLQGVLRFELEARVSDHLARFLREPRVITQSYIRIAMDGAIGSPGFYTVPSNMPLADVIMLAGGPAAGSRLLEIRIERGERSIWTGYPLQDALAGGMTVDQLRLRDGDRVFIPQRSGLGGAEGTVRTVSYLLALPLSIVALLSIF